MFKIVKLPEGKHTFFILFVLSAACRVAIWNERSLLIATYFAGTGSFGKKRYKQNLEN